MQWVAILVTRCVPSKWRTRLYSWILKRIPAPHFGAMRCRRIAPGIYLKTAACCVAEAATLRMVARYTSIPVPQILDVVPSAQPGMWHLLMTELPGDNLMSVWKSLDENQRYDVALQLREWVDQLRGIPSPYGNAICAPGRSSFMCIRADEDDPIGPFDSISDFHVFLTRIFLLTQLVTPPLAEPLRIARAREPYIRFTHGDLKTHNLMFNQGKLSGIIDWESSGWLPDYWEFTSAHWPFRRDRENPWHICVGLALDHYPNDLEAEAVLRAAQY
ncbi:hypothetical protein Hypma_005295 [Hypsizygus marmoreus]|uniref:Aminoglycoside phosphotransferase domain-containing protein n=1 Tax=Hypsizygus marmoreus TaxID=39966 RepID=A0A369K738_HYPMA|nr:hypothetical protein Hypma_005295 [Hypsizygus marmoreus]